MHARYHEFAHALFPELDPQEMAEALRERSQREVVQAIQQQQQRHQKGRRPRGGGKCRRLESATALIAGSPARGCALLWPLSPWHGGHFSPRRQPVGGAAPRLAVARAAARRRRGEGARAAARGGSARAAVSERLELARGCEELGQRRGRHLRAPGRAARVRCSQEAYDPSPPLSSGREPVVREARGVRGGSTSPAPIGRWSGLLRRSALPKRSLRGEGTSRARP